MKEVRERTVNINPLIPYTVPEVARIIGVHPNTVRDWCDQKKIGYSRLGYRTIRIIGQDVLDFLDNNRESPNNSNNTQAK